MRKTVKGGLEDLVKTHREREMCLKTGEKRIEGRIAGRKKKEKNLNMKTVFPYLINLINRVLCESHKRIERQNTKILL